MKGVLIIAVFHLSCCRVGFQQHLSYLRRTRQRVVFHKEERVMIFISSRLISHLTSSHLTSSQQSSHNTSHHITSSHLTSSHYAIYHLIPNRLTNPLHHISTSVTADTTLISRKITHLNTLPLLHFLIPRLLWKTGSQFLTN